MDVRVRFPVTTPFHLEDCWPLTGHDGAIFEFERDNQIVKAVVLTFRDQPVTSAPRLTRLTEGPVKANLEVHSDIETMALRIVGRFLEFINLYFTIDVIIDDIEFEYIPTNEREQEEIHLFKLHIKKSPPPRFLPFNMLAQAFFAGESVHDPSFASHLARKARNAFVSKQYLDAFRHCFLLIEAIYGDGEFKKAKLIRALHANSDFKQMVHKTIAAFLADPIHGASKGRKLAERYPTPEKMIDRLVDRRGFYFHGNLARQSAWHPDRQAEAEEIADVAVHLAGVVAHSFASSMFSSGMGARYFKNAVEQGAVMAVNIDYRFIDRSSLLQRGRFVGRFAAKTVTNALAISVHTEFLKWVELELEGTLVSAIARDDVSGTELFRAQYFSDGASIDRRSSKA